MYSVILCGGSGARLWPLSRKNFPKQFLSLYSGYSLLQETYLRARALMPEDRIFCITNNDNLFNVFNQIKDISKNFSRAQILVEPASRNTAPAIAYSIKHLLDKARINPQEPIIFIPSDHYIGNIKKYLEVMKAAAGNVNGNIGAIGITPTAPETGYGYIKKGEKSGAYYKVLKFKEKPGKNTAQKYLDSGEYVWNSGMYLFSGETFSRELKKHSPGIYGLFSRSLDVFLKKFNTLPSISIDCAISEKSDRVVVFEGNFDWNDIGSFDSLSELRPKDPDPKHLGIDSKNVFVHSNSNRLVATLGVENMNIIETSDSILVQKQGRGEDVKKIVELLRGKGMKELEHNLIVHRPWGKYEVLIDQPAYKVKKITVYPGAKLSLQSHRRRAEHWVVVRGTADIVNGGKKFILRENESAYIPKLAKHRLGNSGKINLEMVEVQTGDYLEEDDIVRYDDDYNRKK